MKYVVSPSRVDWSKTFLQEEEKRGWYAQTPWFLDILGLNDLFMFPIKLSRRIFYQWVGWNECYLLSSVFFMGLLNRRMFVFRMRVVIYSRTVCLIAEGLFTFSKTCITYSLVRIQALKRKLPHYQNKENLVYFLWHTAEST